MSAGGAAVNAFPPEAYVVASVIAIIGSGADLLSIHRRPPWISARFAGWWGLILVLDGIAGTVAVAISSALTLQRHASWLASPIGWVLLGLVATIIVRANLLMLPIGIASVPLGFGVVYGTLRSLFERPLRDRLWEVNFGEADGRLQWALAKVDADGTSLTFERVSKAVADYVSYATAPTAPAPVRDLRSAITTAESEPNEVEQVKFLVTFMVDNGYTAPVYRLLGRPKFQEVRAWRSPRRSP